MHDLKPSRLPLSDEFLLCSDLEPAGETIVCSPYDSSVLAKVKTGGIRHVEDALKAAYALSRNRTALLSIPERIVILQRTAEVMNESKHELAVLAASEGGKPLRDSQVEVTRAIDGIQLCIENLRSHRGAVIPIATTPATSGRAAFTQKEPIGVVVAVSAFNHPLNLIVHQVAPAVATGCPVIVKPAGETPLSCLNFVRILHEAGLPPEWCQAIVTDSNASAEKLVTDPRVDFFSFIGSASVGWMLRSKLSPGTRCALEHGGVAPAILLDDYVRESALTAIAKGGFYHAGQVCVSVQRVFAPGKHARRFATDLAVLADKLVVGDPLDEATEVGPLIRKAEVERIDEWVQEAVGAGGELLCGGTKLTNNGYSPTVILDPPVDVRLSQLEVFGPVICVYSYGEIADAIDQANSLPTAFQAAVFGKDVEQMMSVSSRLDATAVMLNDHTAFRDDVMPFAGLRESGLGTGGIPYTMEDMQIDKMVVVRNS